MFVHEKAMICSKLNEFEMHYCIKFESSFNEKIFTQMIYCGCNNPILCIILKRKKFLVDQF